MAVELHWANDTQDEGSMLRHFKLFIKGTVEKAAWSSPLVSDYNADVMPEVAAVILL